MSTKTRVNSTPKDRTIRLHINNDEENYIATVDIPKEIEPKHWRKYLFSSLQKEFGQCTKTDTSGWHFNHNGFHTNVTVYSEGPIEVTSIYQFKMHIG